MRLPWQISSSFKQCAAALVSLSLHLSLGLCQGFSAVLIPQFEADDSTIKVTNAESSWIASIPVISMPMAALFVGVLMETFGRKRVIQLAFIPLILGWTFISLSDSIFMIYAGRFLTGFAVGMDPAVIVYIAETNTPKYRATLLSLTGPTILVGTFLSYTLGHYLYWKYAAFILACFSAACCGCLFLIPESPIWLVSKDDMRAASKSLKWLRGADEVADSELEDLHKAQLMKTEQNSGQLSLCQKIRATKAWKPFLILTCYFLLQQFAGNNIILSYAVSFFQEFDTRIEGYLCSAICIASSFCMSLIFTAIVDQFNRKTLSVISAGGVCVTCAAAATYEFVYEAQSNDDKPFVWFPLICVWLGVAFSVLGLNTLPWLMAGELFPTQVRGFMTSALWMSVYFYIFVTVKIYPLIVPVIRISGVLTMFSVSAFLALIFCILMLPETRGKTLMEIEMLW